MGAIFFGGKANALLIVRESRILSFFCSMITALIDGHCDGGTRGDLFGMISPSESVEMR